MLKNFVNWLTRSDRKIYWEYSVLALLVMLPLLKPGFILTLDMVFTPRVPMPEGVTSSYLFNAALHYLSILLPSEIIQKTMLFMILVLSGAGAHKIVQSNLTERRKQEAKSVGLLSRLAVPAYFAGILYMINPFTYARFMTGQYNVLLGYALMPFFARYLLNFLYNPNLKTTLRMTGLALAISIVSIHSIGLMVVMVTVAGIMALWRYRGQRQHLMALTKYGAAGGALVVVASSYWLLPTLLGNSKTAQSIQNFDEIHRQAFATEGTGQFGAIGNVMSLQGFWADAQTLYLLPRDVSHWWLLPLALILILVIFGAVKGWRERRFITVFLVVTALAAIILAVGATPGLFAPLNRWLIDHIPFFAGYREPQKFVGLIALAYACLGAMGVEAILKQAGNQKNHSPVSRILPSTLLLLLPILYMPTMLWGFEGQLKPRYYPADWHAVNRQLNDDTGNFKVLFLPWHQYMRFDFAGRIIANPADKFFDRVVITGDNPEFGGISPSVPDPIKQQVEAFILQPAREGNPIGEQLANLEIKYVILAKEADYQDYSSLDKQSDLQLMSETATMKLYRNKTFKD